MMSTSARLAGYLDLRRRFVVPHGERVASEIDEHSHAMAGSLDWGFSGHVSSLQIHTDARGVPGVVAIGPRICLSGRQSDGFSCAATHARCLGTARRFMSRFQNGRRRSGRESEDCQIGHE